MNRLLNKGSKQYQHQQGAMIVVTLIILLIVSVLGMATMSSTGLEMRMASNTRDQQQAFEAAEYTLSWVQNEISIAGFSDTQLLDNFDVDCPNGYCFRGDQPTNPASCTLDAPATEFYADEDIWTDSGKYRTLAVPNVGVTTRYIIEFRCYTALDPTQPMDPATNFTKVYRITVLAIGPADRGKVMLRSTFRVV